MTTACCSLSLVHYCLVGTMLHQDQSQAHQLTPYFLISPDSFLYLELLPFARKTGLDPQPFIQESQHFSTKDPVLFFHKHSVLLSTPRSCRQQSGNSRAPLQTTAGKFFCSGIIEASGGRYERSKGSYETTKSPRA